MKTEKMSFTIVPVYCKDCKHFYRYDKDEGWCRKEIESIAYTKFIGQTKYNFCSAACKKNFRKHLNKNKSSSCPACALRR